MLFFGLLYRRRVDVKKLGQQLQLESERSGIVTVASDLSDSIRQRSTITNLRRRRPSIVNNFESLLYLVSLCENFRCASLSIVLSCPIPTLNHIRLSPSTMHGSANRYYMGVWLLLFRLAQTSLMTLVRTQLAQAAIMCCITWCAAFVQRELSPFTRLSDNHVALMGHWLIFSWVFVMLLRLAGLLQTEFAASVVGCLLCIVTLAVFGTAAVLANDDRRAEARASEKAGANDQEDTSEPLSSDDAIASATLEEGEGDSAVGVTAGTGAPQHHIARGEECMPPPPEPPDDEGPSAWLTRVVGSKLCLDDGAAQQAKL